MAPIMATVSGSCVDVRHRTLGTRDGCTRLRVQPHRRRFHLPVGRARVCVRPHVVGVTLQSRRGRHAHVVQDQGTSLCGHGRRHLLQEDRPAPRRSP